MAAEPWIYWIVYFKWAKLWYVNCILIKLFKKSHLWSLFSRSWVESWKTGTKTYELVQLRYFVFPCEGNYQNSMKSFYNIFLYNNNFNFGERWLDDITSLLRIARVILKTKSRQTYYLSIISMFTSFSFSKASCFSSSRFISNASVSALLDSEESLMCRSWTFCQKRK